MRIVEHDRIYEIMRDEKAVQYFTTVFPKSGELVFYWYCALAF
jgi:hypothetical protein